jgi:Raf kinase inhibitor-like YbhB/YbcL family protein
MSSGKSRGGRRWDAAPALVACVCALWACGQSSQPATRPGKHDATGETAMKITIQSAAFKAEQAMPKKHTGEGADVSPALSWSGVPAEAKELALICDDPDAPRPEPWVHWVLYKLPPTLTGLPEAVPAKAKLTEPAGALQGKNSWNTVGYRGPLPPPGHGVHHYHFKLYALKTALDAPPELTKDELLKRIKPLVLAEGDLVGTYQR